MVRSVTVTIAGQQLSIRTDASDPELRELARTVNERVDAIRGASSTAPPAKVYLLAALSMADELRQVRAELEKVRAAVATQAQGALQFLEGDD